MASNALLIILAASLVVFVPGLVLLVAGFRGRVLRRHPACRRCSYDLHGTEHLTTCPECGSDLTKRRAIKPVVRQKRPGFIIAGLIIVTLFVSGAGSIIYLNTKQIEWLEYAPATLLESWMEHPSVSLRDRVLDEILRRDNLGELDDQWRLRFAQEALDIQADATKQWHVQYGELIVGAIADGTLPPEEWQRYVKQQLPQTMTASWDVRAHPGDALKLGIEGLELRSAPNSKVMPRDIQYAVSHNGRKLRNSGGGWGCTYGQNTPHVIKASTRTQAAHDLDPGPTSFDVTFNITFEDDSGTFAPLTVPLNVTCPVQIYPEDEPLVDLDATIATLEDIRQCFTATANVLISSQRHNAGAVILKVDKPPCNLAFDILVRVDKQERSIGTFGASADDHAQTALALNFRNDEQFFDALIQRAAATNTIAFVLRADPAAIPTIRNNDWRIWSGEIVMDIPFVLPEESRPKQ